MNENPRLAVITGATAGIGRYTALGWRDRASAS